MGKKYMFCFSFLLYVSLALTYAGESPPSPYISKGACPYEGCKYGEWKVLKTTRVHSKPDPKSPVLFELKPGQVAVTITGEVHVIPGLAKMTGKPYKNVVAFDPDVPIYILDYIGEGYSRIYHKGQYLETKIARTKTDCKEHNDWRRCWVEVLREPISKWWVKVKLPNEAIEGWALVEDGNLQTTDEFS